MPPTVTKKKKVFDLSILVIGICIVGALTCVLPWETESKPGKKWDPQTKKALDQVDPVYGVRFWHGRAAAVLFVGLSSLLTATCFKKPAPLWRPIPGLFVGLGVLGSVGLFLSSAPIALSAKATAVAVSKPTYVMAMPGCYLTLVLGSCLLLAALYQSYAEL